MRYGLLLSNGRADCVNIVYRRLHGHLKSSRLSMFIHLAAAVQPNFLILPTLALLVIVINIVSWRPQIHKRAKSRICLTLVLNAGIVTFNGVKIFLPL